MRGVANKAKLGGARTSAPSRKHAVAVSVKRPRRTMAAVQAPAAAAAESPKAVAAALFASDKRPIILFDGVCNMCNTFVNLALDLDPEGRFRFAALQSAVGRALLQANGRAADDISSIVLVEQSAAHTQSSAVLRIAQGLGDRLGALRAFGSLGFLVPSFLRDGVYGVVARNRYSVFGRTDACRLGDAGKFKARFIESAP